MSTFLNQPAPAVSGRESYVSPSASKQGTGPWPARGDRPWWRVGVSWALQIGLAFMFLMAGSMKLGSDPQMVAMFDVIGVGQWFRYLTGGIEVGSALALLHPAFAFYGALLLVPTMLGAVATHLFIVGGSPVVPIVLLGLVSAVAWDRRPR